MARVQDGLDRFTPKLDSDDAANRWIEPQETLTVDFEFGWLICPGIGPKAKDEGIAVGACEGFFVGDLNRREAVVKGEFDRCEGVESHCFLLETKLRRTEGVRVDFVDAERMLKVANGNLPSTGEVGWGDGKGQKGVTGSMGERMLRESQSDDGCEKNHETRQALPVVQRHW